MDCNLSYLGSNVTEYYIMNPNSTEAVVVNGSGEHGEVWKERIRAVSYVILREL